MDNFWNFLVSGQGALTLCITSIVAGVVFTGRNKPGGPQTPVAQKVESVGDQNTIGQHVDNRRYRNETTTVVRPSSSVQTTSGDDLLAVGLGVAAVTIGTSLLVLLYGRLGVTVTAATTLFVFGTRLGEATA